MPHFINLFQLSRLFSLWKKDPTSWQFDSSFLPFTGISLKRAAGQGLPQGLGTLCPLFARRPREACAATWAQRLRPQGGGHGAGLCLSRPRVGEEGGGRSSWAEGSQQLHRGGALWGKEEFSKPLKDSTFQPHFLLTLFSLKTGLRRLRGLGGLFALLTHLSCGNKRPFYSLKNSSLQSPPLLKYFLPFHLYS